MVVRSFQKQQAQGEEQEESNPHARSALRVVVRVYPEVFPGLGPLPILTLAPHPHALLLRVKEPIDGPLCGLPRLAARPRNGTE